MGQSSAEYGVLGRSHRSGKQVPIARNSIVHFWLHHTSHCAEKIVSVHLRAGSASGGWGHMVAAWLSYERAMVGIRWATPFPDCMDRLRKYYSHLVEGWFLARKAALALRRCMTTKSADYCILINEWA